MANSSHTSHTVVGRTIKVKDTTKEATLYVCLSHEDQPAIEPGRQAGGRRRGRQTAREADSQRGRHPVSQATRPAVPRLESCAALSLPAPRHGLCTLCSWIRGGEAAAAGGSSHVSAAF